MDRLAVRFDRCRGVERLVSPDRGLAAVPEVQVVSHLMERRRGANERLADELVPESQRHHRVGARQVGDARAARRHMEVRVGDQIAARARARRSVTCRRRRAERGIETRELGAWLAARMRVQDVVEQALAGRVEAPPTHAALLPHRQLRRRDQLFAVVANRRVPQNLQAELPANRSRISGELTRRVRRIARPLVDNLPAAAKRRRNEIALGFDGRVVVNPSRVRHRAERVIRVDVADVEMRGNAVSRILVAEHLQHLRRRHVRVRRNSLAIERRRHARIRCGR